MNVNEKIYIFFFWRGVKSGGGGVRVDVNEEVTFL